MSDIEDSDIGNPAGGQSVSLSRKKAKEHVEQLQRLQEKDPEFYQYLKDHDKELLEFNDEDIDEDEETDFEADEETQPAVESQKKPEKAVTTAMVDSWCKAIKEERKLGAIRSLLRAFRLACHCGDDSDVTSPKFSIVSSNVFNKIMVFVLNEMDGILRGLLGAPNTGGKKETIMDLTTTKTWAKHGTLMRIYLSNTLHILTEMTDEQMISFTLKRVKASGVFLAAFPTLLRKYIKVALHSWGTGRGALPIVSFLFLRDLCVRLGSDCLDTCLKGMYKAYVMNCKLSKSVSRSKQQHIHFLGNCVTELYGVDVPSAYQHAFVFIRQLAVILRGALTVRGDKVVKEKKDKKQRDGSKSSRKQLDKAYQKVYDWQFISCLELWTGVICAYNSEAEFGPLAYPLAQIISGVASLVPTARYIPLRLRCMKMLNRLAGATGTYIPVSSHLLDMLEMKELHKRSTGGVGKAVNLLSVKQVDKTTLKTRAFQEECTYYLVEELAEHLAQWSYSPAFFELSFIPLVRLRSFCKSTDVDRSRREIKELIRQVEANSEFTNSKRATADISPDLIAIESFLKAEKETGSSPLSQFADQLRLRAQQRIDAMVESSVIVGAESSIFSSKLSEIEEDEEHEGDEEEANNVFSSSWLPEKKSKVPKEKPKESKKRSHEEYEVEGDEDLVEDLVLSSDEEEDDDKSKVDSASEDEDHPSLQLSNKKRKPDNSSKQNIRNGRPVTNSSKKRRPRPKKASKGSK
ncbi:nucleolar complex protein 2 homolog isoform X2 [Asparagus officinalis]|uniref:nucleolar complex protein 2 homolog isoform X2 n=1 Tax=Asparagus officinalis TaxID=4686 RepID=UPI00098E4F3A|nr:nucleolar complex protein 2 homolog isoform X2 [Asparagus officinalis]